MSSYEYDLEVIKKMFTADKFAGMTGIEIESADDDCVVCSLVIGDKHKNAAGGVQGGVIFTLCDYTFAVHSNLGLFRDDPTASVTVVQSASVSFMKATRGKILYGRSTLLHKGRHTNVYRIEITDDNGVSISQALFNGFSTGRMPGEKAIP